MAGVVLAFLSKSSVVLLLFQTLLLLTGVMLRQLEIDFLAVVFCKTNTLVRHHLAFLVIID